MSEYCAELPSSNDVAVNEAAECGAAIGDWYEALSGQRSLEAALAVTCRLLNVEVGLVCRHGTTGPKLGYQKVIYSDRGASNPAVIPIQKSYAESLLGDHAPSVKVGSVWRMSDLDGFENCDPGLLAAQQRRGFRDYTVIVLANNDGQLDLLEFHSFEVLDSGSSAVLASILPLILRAWRQRPAGTISLAFSKRAIRLDVTKLNAPILSLENPFGLSRCEYRVCHLMKGGLLPKALAEELSKSPATIRSHLRSIFAKTGATNQTELLFRLMKAEKTADESRLRA